jgi:radical SAM/Cys-rich protein
MAAFKERIQSINPAYSKFDRLQTLQLNLGNLCNLRCAHCHVTASPSGNKVMGRDVMETVIGFLKHRKDITLDITGGCPEMNPNFRYIIEGTTGLSERRLIRSNLTILHEKEMEWLPRFFRDHRLTVIASLPCYLEKNVDRQRGKGTFTQSINALQILNNFGYGDSLELNLVYNPGGDYLPGSQEGLESAYKEHLYKEYGISFNKLYTIANAPIGRFKEYLQEKGAYERYMDLLTANFNPDTAPHIMCRTMISVDWQGVLYNCDFNQAAGLPIASESGISLHICDLEKAAKRGNDLFLGQHCYCCTAGEGSSCTGSLAA